MPYDFTPGDPDFRRALIELDPKHCTRKPRKARRRDHVHLDDEFFEGAVELITEFSAEHGSKNVYFRLAEPVAANCTVLPVTDPRIEWRYDEGSSRQSARPYVSGLDHGTTVYGKRCFDQKTKKVRTQHSIPAELVPKHEGDVVPPGDPIAYWNRLRKAGLDESSIVGVLCGGDVCVYSSD
jgi:hypothetical protein